jgi:hypothetical protein
MHVTSDRAEGLAHAAPLRLDKTANANEKKNRGPKRLLANWLRA